MNPTTAPKPAKPDRALPVGKNAFDGGKEQLTFFVVLGKLLAEQSMVIPREGRKQEEWPCRAAEPEYRRFETVQAPALPTGEGIGRGTAIPDDLWLAASEFAHREGVNRMPSEFVDLIVPRTMPRRTRYRTTQFRRRPRRFTIKTDPELSLREPLSTKSSAVEIRSRSEALEVIGKIGRGEWIRTTDLLVPKQAYPAISLNTERIFSCKTSI